MRLLLVNYEYPPMGGGAANATMFLGRAFVAAGHEVTVLTSGAAGLAARETTDGVRVVRLASMRRARHGSNPLEMCAYLACALARARAVAVENGSEGVVAFFSIPSGPVALRLSRALGLPYVVSLRGSDVPGHDGSVAWLHRITAPMRRMVLKRARAVVANSASLGALSERADAVRVKVIPNGVDTDFFAPAPEAAPREAGALRLLFVGRLRYEKNLAHLLREIAPVKGFTLDVVGDGPDRARMEALASQLGLADRVTWHGWRSKDDVAAMYRRSDCLVNPSLFEGMPNAVLEAMAAGLPVVASDVGGNNEVVEDGRTGFLFPLGREGALRERLERLAGDRALRRSLGAAARAAAVERHSWRRAADAYASLLAP